MSVHVSSWVWRHTKTVPASLRLVLVRLADIANDKGEAYPSLTTLAEDVNKKKRQIINDIAELERLGLIVKFKRFDKSGRSTSNLFRIVMDGTAEEARVQRSAPSKSAAECTLPVQPAAPSPCSPVHRPKSEPSVEPSSEPTEQPPPSVDSQRGDDGAKAELVAAIAAYRERCPVRIAADQDVLDLPAFHAPSGAVRLATCTNAGLMRATTAKLRAAVKPRPRKGVSREFLAMEAADRAAAQRGHDAGEWISANWPADADPRSEKALRSLLAALKPPDWLAQDIEFALFARYQAADADWRSRVERLRTQFQTTSPRGIAL